MTQQGDTIQSIGLDWMLDVESPELLAFLERRNADFERAMAAAADLEREIFDEIVARTPPRDTSVPYRYGEYEYRYVHEKGREHPRFERRSPGAGDRWRTILDFAPLAEGCPACDIQICIDRASRRLAIAVDPTGARVYDVQIRDVETGAVLTDRIKGASGNMAFSRCGQAFFYTELDVETLRWRRVLRHRPGTDPETAELVHEEEDPAFSCFIDPAKSDSLIFVRSSSGEEDEIRFLAADDPFGPARLIVPRAAGREYDAQFDGESLIVRTNERAPDFRLTRAPPDAPGVENWREIWAPEPGAYLEAFEVVRGAVAVVERANGQLRLRLLSSRDGAPRPSPPAAPPASYVFRDNFELDAAAIRYEWARFTEHTRICELDAETGAVRVLKVEEAAGGFDPARYRARSLSVMRDDGTPVPVTLLSRRGDRKHPRPTLVYAYGAYGFSIDPYLWLPRFSLIDRGFRIAIAHIRGGGELGKGWHDAGRRGNKPASMADFVACADFLLASGLASRLYAMGESAGAVPVAAALNARPELFSGAVVVAPFVDLLTSLSDPTLPLTTTDYGEWGNPTDPEERAWIAGYAPVHNVRRQPYPPLLALARLHDTQVAVWEAARWIARIRELATGGGPHLLKTEFEAGHMGRSGRHEQFRDTATAYAFLIGIERGLVH